MKWGQNSQLLGFKHNTGPCQLAGWIHFPLFLGLLWWLLLLVFYVHLGVSLLHSVFWKDSWGFIGITLEQVNLRSLPSFLSLSSFFSFLFSSFLSLYFPSFLFLFIHSYNASRPQPPLVFSFQFTLLEEWTTSFTTLSSTCSHEMPSPGFWLPLTCFLVFGIHVLCFLNHPWVCMTLTLKWICG